MFELFGRTEPSISAGICKLQRDSRLTWAWIGCRFAAHCNADQRTRNSENSCVLRAYSAAKCDCAPVLALALAWGLVNISVAWNGRSPECPGQPRRVQLFWFSWRGSRNLAWRSRDWAADWMNLRVVCMTSSAPPATHAPSCWGCWGWLRLVITWPLVHSTASLPRAWSTEVSEILPCFTIENTFLTWLQPLLLPRLFFPVTCFH